MCKKPDFFTGVSLGQACAGILFHRKTFAENLNTHVSEPEVLDAGKGTEREVGWVENGGNCSGVTLKWNNVRREYYRRRSSTYIYASLGASFLA